MASSPGKTTVFRGSSSGDVYEKGVPDESAEEVVEGVDCCVLGSRTYQRALQLGCWYGYTPTVVISKPEVLATRKSAELY